MDQLKSSIDNLAKTLEATLNHPKFLYNIAKKEGGDVTREECADIMTRVSKAFVEKFQRRTDELIRDLEIPEKLEEIAEVIEDNKEFLEQCSLKDGYRPKGPREDIKADIVQIQEAYRETIHGEVEALQQEIENKRALLETRRQLMMNKAKLLEGKLQ